MNQAHFQSRGELKKKAIRALYGLKNTVHKPTLSFRSLTTLFDSLIKPIVLYGAPVHTPTMSILKDLVKFINSSTPQTKQFAPASVLRKISSLNSEKVHLHFLKWALGVNRKASNAGTWGESGRHPLIYEAVNLTLKYFKRLQGLKDNSLVSLAIKEQIDLNLDWYKGIKQILQLDSQFSENHVALYRAKNNKPSSPTLPHKEIFLIHNGFKKRIPQQKVTPNISRAFTPHHIMKQLKGSFKSIWRSSINSSSKLHLYSTLKTHFTKEHYLDLIKTYQDRANMTRIRISAHRLEIETGRYKNIPKNERTCSWCNLVFNNKDVEDELHLLNSCDLYAKDRSNLVRKLNMLNPTTRESITNTTNFLKIICNTDQNTPGQAVPANSHQAHVSRIVSRYITNCLKNRSKFLDPSKQNNLEGAK